MSDHDRTEEPTPRRLREARERGEVPKSALASAALVWLGVGGVIALSAESALAAWSALVEALLAPVPPAPDEALGSAAVVAARIVAGPLAAAVALGALGSFLQVGPLWTWRPLTPGLARCSPGRGRASVFAPAELAARVGALALVVAVLALAAWVGAAALPGLLARPEASPSGVLDLAGAALGAFHLRTGALLVGAGAVALVFRRIQHRLALRMSRRELRREQRDLEGQPEARRRRATVHREQALGPSSEAALEGAALVVRGPGCAVVLRWDPASDAPPRIVRVARGPLALRIVGGANRLGVPAVYDEPLAAALERAVAEGLVRPWRVRLAWHLARVGRAR